MEYICKCGSKSFYVQEKGPHKGLYCIHCDKWLTWVNNKTVDALKREGVIKSKSTYIKEAEQVVPEINNGAAITENILGVYNNLSIEQNANISTKAEDEEEGWTVIKQGCELCSGGKLIDTYCGGNMQLLKGSLIIHKPDGTINYQFGATVNYCPHCGREVRRIE